MSLKAALFTAVSSFAALKRSLEITINSGSQTPLPPLMPEPPIRHTGLVCSFKPVSSSDFPADRHRPKKYVGFIRPDTEGIDIQIDDQDLHLSGIQTLERDQRVSYTTREERGKILAINLKIEHG